jgi:mRNA interferase RelE/StbE
MFQIRFSEEALYQLKKMDNQVAKRIIQKIDESKETPIHFFKRLSGREEYKLRVGDYRILARVIPIEKIIFIQSIGHRKNIYKR